MSSISDIGRLNVLIELFSECANVSDRETLLRVAAGRLRWIIEFDQCVFAFSAEADGSCWVATHAEEALRRVALADLPETEVALIESVLETGAPAAQSAGRICIPLQGSGGTLGALCFSSAVGNYTYRDMRLVHHAGQYLGSLISRLKLEAETKRLSKRKDDLLALLGHELRNPLAPIVTAVHLLKARSAGQPSKELEVIERQAQHLVRLLDDLLDVARLTRGKTVISLAPVEVSEVVARAVEMVSPLLQQRRHSLAIDVPSVGLIVQADEHRLVQVLSNLLSNAGHYTEQGGKITITAYRDAEAVVLEVSDNGVGIAVDALADIFELFVQGPNRASGQGGLGLGLVVVKQLTELHGGTVSVASEGDGRGTKFTVRLPALPAGTITARLATASLLVPRADEPERVLLVDDNEDALDLLSTFVENAGHEVAIAHDGQEALEVMERFFPTVAVIDINMPLIDGNELATRIRAQHSLQERPYLVALTGYDQAADRERSHAAGFNAHLVKPVDLAQLLRVIAGARVASTGTRPGLPRPTAVYGSEI
jgi:signal transduction histidine kinase/CheY-like chemotaxis protein